MSVKKGDCTFSFRFLLRVKIVTPKKGPINSDYKYLEILVFSYLDMNACMQDTFARARTRPKGLCSR